MRISTKIAASSGMFVILLGAVVVYQLSLVRALVAANRDFSTINFQAATLALDFIEHLGEVHEFAWKVSVTRDPVYAESWLASERQLNALLDKLQALDLAPAEAGSVILLSRAWEAFREHAALRLGRDRLTEESELIARQELSLDDLDREAQIVEEWLRRQIEGVQEPAREIINATERSIAARIEKSKAGSREAERISLGVVAVALLMILLLGIWTHRTIRTPLRRFVAGARAVGDGKFDVQLDESNGDEFARPAAAFNSMARRLGELDRLKKDFLAHVSHELKTPLASMQETNTVLLDELAGPLNDRQRRVVSLNLDSARRLSAMISNLLDLSRLEAGALEYDFKPHDFVALVELVLAELEGRRKAKGLWLEADLARRPLLVYGDRDRLIQVVENLYENAVKFSAPTGTLSLELSVTTAVPENMPERWRRQMILPCGGRVLLLAITDCGPGVPDEHKEKIFEKFHQVGASRQEGAVESARQQEGAVGTARSGAARVTSVRTGVGLGLAICREIVEAHRGALWVTDTDAGGSTFFLLLPVDARAVPQPLEAAPSDAVEKASLPAAIPQSQ